MKPNGRRRWRRWARTYRKYAKRTSDADFVAMAAWWRRHTDLEVIQPLPPRPFTLASLVGMTRGARKRLRDRVVWGTRHDGVEAQVLRLANAAEMSVSEVLGLPGLGIESCNGSGVLPARRAKP